MEELNKRITELFQEMGCGQGLNDDLLMTIFTTLYLEPEPIAMDDLVKKTGYSLASISNKTKMLGPIMNIKRTRKPGSKKIYLYMDKNILSIWRDMLIKKEEHVVNKVKEKLPAILKEYKGKVKTAEDKKKLEIMESYHDQVLKLGEIINKIIKEFEGIE